MDVGLPSSGWCAQNHCGPPPSDQGRGEGGLWASGKAQDCAPAMVTGWTGYCMPRAGKVPGIAAKLLGARPQLGS